MAASIAAPLSGPFLAVVCVLPTFRSAKGRSLLVIIIDIPPELFDGVFAAVAEAEPPVADADRVVRIGAFSVTAEEALAAGLLRVDARVGTALFGAPLDFEGMEGECCTQTANSKHDVLYLFVFGGA